MNKLKERFERMYKGCKLFAVHLDGFTHEVFYKDEKGEKHIDSCSAYYGAYEPSSKHFNSRGDFAWCSFNEDKTKELFLGYAHCSYQGNAQEYCYEDSRNW